MKQDTYNKQSLEMWEGYSLTYSKKQNCPSVFTLSLINMLRIADAKNIIEAGCGAGYLHPYMISKKNPKAHLSVLDFSQEMVKLSAARVLKFLNQNQPGSLDTLTVEEFKNVQLDHQQLKNINYHPFVGSVEDLSQFQDNCFDVYLSNLCFQLVDNQEKAIAEAFRILAPGGKIGVSVWGKRDNCNSITLISDALVDAGMMQQYFNPKFIDDKSIIIQRFKDAGFTNILCWNQIAAFDIYCYEDMENYSNPETVQFIEKATQEQKDLYKKAIQKRIQEKQDQNIPFTFECIMVIAQKPV